VIPFRRADPPADSFLIYGSVWAVLKYLQVHSGWHERGHLLKRVLERERSIRQSADTVTLLVRYGWAEQREEQRTGFARPRRLLRVGLRVRLVADRRRRKMMVRSSTPAARARSRLAVSTSRSSTSPRSAGPTAAHAVRDFYQQGVPVVRAFNNGRQ